jgi:hypothetical protein
VPCFGTALGDLTAFELASQLVMGSLSPLLSSGGVQLAFVGFGLVCVLVVGWVLNIPAGMVGYQDFRLANGCPHIH